MNDVELYHRLNEVKGIIATLLGNKKSMIDLYKDIRGTITTNLDRAKLTTSFMEAVNGYSLAHKKDFSSEEFNALIIEKLSGQGYGSSSLTSNPMKADCYISGFLCRAALDLAVMKEANLSTSNKPNLAYQTEMCKKYFAEAAKLVGDRYSYKAYFPDFDSEDYKQKPPVHKEVSGGWGGFWQLPIRKTWYSRVYLKGLANTDIAGKPVMTLDAKIVKGYEKHLEDFEKDAYKVYQVKVGYAKSVNKGRIVDCSTYLDLNEETIVPNQTVAEFHLNNPRWVEHNQIYGVSIQAYKDVVFKRTPYGTIDPEAAVIVRRAHGSLSKREKFIYREYQSATLGFLEDRYIAAYQERGMEAPKLACGTSMLRAISVLRNRISKDVTKKLGVI